MRRSLAFRLFRILAATTLWLAFLPAAHPQQFQLSEQALFVRCYKQLTRSVPAFNNPLYQDVLANRKSAIDACLDLLAKASFGSNGYMVNQSDPEALKVVQTFYKFFLGWFGKKDLGDRPQGYEYRAPYMHDVTEPALMFSRALFANEDVRGVLTSNQAVRGRRDLGAWTTNNRGRDDKKLSNPEAGLERGRLIGVTKYAVGHNTYLTDNGSPHTKMWADYSNYQIDLIRNFGAGFLGPVYFMALSGFEYTGNSDNPTKDPGQSRTSVSNGSLGMPRRLTQDLFATMLCKEEPPVRLADVNTLVVEFLQQFPNQMTEAYRRETTCMSCHHSYDNAAAMLSAAHCQQGRSIDWNANGTTNPRSGSNPDGEDETQFCRLKNTTLPHPPQPQHLTLRTTNFSEMKPRGGLYLRDLNGNLVSITMQASDGMDGFRQLGAAIVGTDQFYACMAKKLYRHFIGLDVNLGDPGDPRTGVFSSSEAYHRSIVSNLGTRLRQNGGILSKTIEDILRSAEYRKSGLTP